MRHLKLFESFIEENKLLGTYTQDQFDEFCEDVKKWGDEKKVSPYGWYLYEEPNSDRKEQRREEWKGNIRDGILFVMEERRRLIGIIVDKNGNVISARDSYNNKIDTSKFDPEFETI
jgi:hypothetical protein